MASRSSHTGPRYDGGVDAVPARRAPDQPDGDTHPGRAGRQERREMDGRRDGREVAQRRMRHRRKRAGVLLLLLAAAGLIAADLVRGGSHAAPPPPASTAAEPAAPTAAAPTTTVPSSAPQATYPGTGRGTFRYAARDGALLGSAGRLRRFHVAVEDGIALTPAAFGDAADTILGDPRGWTASKRLRLQRVSKMTAADFTIFLATPGTSEKMCAAGGLSTQRFTSCRLPGQVIINMARWSSAVPNYGAPIEVYRAYVINHEVGHQLGYGHEACPGAGEPAPVMQQQTYGLQGCTANGWPYLDGRRYSGPAVA